MNLPRRIALLLTAALTLTLAACSPPTKTFIIPESVEDGPVFVETERDSDSCLDLDVDRSGEIIVNDFAYACVTGKLVPEDEHELAFFRVAADGTRTALVPEQDVIIESPITISRVGCKITGYTFRVGGADAGTRTTDDILAAARPDCPNPIRVEPGAEGMGEIGTGLDGGELEPMGGSEEEGVDGDGMGEDEMEPMNDEGEGGMTEGENVTGLDGGGEG